MSRDEPRTGTNCLVTCSASYDVASILNPDPYYNVVRKHDARDGDPGGRAGRGVKPITLRRSGNYVR